MSSPLLQMPGAVPAPDESPDTGVPWHFGDPFAEQRSATRSAVLVDRSHRQVIAVPGEERLSWSCPSTSASCRTAGAPRRWCWTATDGWTAT